MSSGNREMDKVWGRAWEREEKRNRERRRIRGQKDEKADETRGEEGRRRKKSDCWLARTSYAIRVFS